MSYYRLVSTSDSFAHHGVLGMKWGIRRYQNYDGTYTKRGMARYNKAKGDYDRAKESSKAAKTKYKSGQGSKSEVKKSKSELKKAEKELNTSYKRLKRDKRADQGKELYSRGKTINDNARRSQLGGALIFTGSRVAQRLIDRHVGNEKVANISKATLALGSSAAMSIIGVKTYMENKKLRAFYVHD